MKQQVNLIFSENANPLNVSVFAQVIAAEIMKEGLQSDGRAKVHGTIKGIRANNRGTKQAYSNK